MWTLTNSFNTKIKKKTRICCWIFCFLWSVTLPWTVSELFHLMFNVYHYMWVCTHMHACMHTSTIHSCVLITAQWLVTEEEKRQTKTVTKPKQCMFRENTTKENIIGCDLNDKLCAVVMCISIWKLCHIICLCIMDKTKGCFIVMFVIAGHQNSRPQLSKDFQVGTVDHWILAGEFCLQWQLTTY